MGNIKVAIVDDVPLFVDGLSLILGLDDSLDVVFTATNGKMFLEKLETSMEKIDVVLLDLAMPVMDGVDTLREIMNRELPVKVIILTSHFNDGTIVKLLEEGASGFLAKNEKPDVVIETIKKVHEKGFFFGNYILQLIRNRRILANRKEIDQDLTKREIEVLKLICEECTNKEIADRLNLSSRTVEGHRQNILSKSGCKNTVGLVIYAIEHQIIEVSVSKYF